MSILSKIFIVLLCVLTIGLSVSVIVAQRNYLRYKNGYIDLQKSKEATEAGVQVLLAQMERDRGNFEKEIQSLRSTLKSEQALAQRLQSEVTQLNVRILGLEKERDEAQLKATNATARADRAEQASNELRTQIGEVVKGRTDIRDKYSKLSEQHSKVLAEKEYLLRQIKLLRERVDQLQQQLQQVGMQQTSAGGESGVDPVGPPIKGKIVSVSDDMAAINVGKADGVAEGMRFTVFRGANYLAELVVTRVEADKSVGRLELRKQTVQLNDDAWNKLSY